MYRGGENRWQRFCGGFDSLRVHQERISEGSQRCSSPLH